MIVHDERVARFVEDKLGVPFFRPYTCIGTERSGEIINGVIFNCFTWPSIHVTIAGGSWNSAIIREVGRYVFGGLKCERITAITEQAKIVRFVERLGGVAEGVLRNHFGRGRDGIVCGILKDDWKHGI